MRAAPFLWALAFLAATAGWTEAARAQIPDDLIPNGNWYRNGATLDLDFYNNRYWLNGNTYSFLTDFMNGAGTFTRSDSTANATYFNSSGTLTTASSGAVRPNYTYNGSSWVYSGDMLEEGRTNSIRNNTMVGAAAGTPGTIPTNWISSANVNGLTQTVVGTGSESGISYIDVTVAGTPTASGSWVLRFNPTSGIAAASGQTWSSSFYYKLSGGSLSNITVLNVLAGYSGSAQDETYTQTITPTNAGLSTQRSVVTNLLGNSSTAYVFNQLQLNYSNGQAVNVTLRIGMPQMEQGYFATSVIATSGSAATRAAESYSEFSRSGSGTATYFNSSGVLTVANANAPRLDYNPSTLVPNGILIEESRTNDVLDSTMSNAAAASTTQLVTNGTFSSCSGSSCTGWTTTVNGGTGSVSFSSGTATLTGDGTNAASIYQAITTVSGYLYTIAVTTGAGNAVTVQAGTTAGGATLLSAQTVSASTTTSYQFSASGTTTYIQINNASMTAANVTTVSVESAGEFPFSCCNKPAGTLVSIANVGTSSNGINYVDFAITGTTTSSAQIILYPARNVSGAASGQTWTMSSYFQLLTSDPHVTGLSLVIAGLGSSCSGQLEDGGGSSFLSSISSLTREYYTYTLANSSDACVNGQIVTNSISSGVTLNWKIRIGMPQFEQGAFPTSVIPTSGSAVTRNPDLLTVGTSAAGSNGAWYSAGVGTLSSVGVIPYYGSSGFPCFADLTDGTVNNRLGLFVTANGGIRAENIVSGGSNIYNPQISSPAYTAGAVCKEALAFQAGDQGAAIDGTSLTDGTVSMPSYTQLSIGGVLNNNNMLNGWVNRVWYMPTRQPDASLPGYTSQ